MLLGALCATLLRNLLASEGVIRAGKVIMKVGQDF